MRKTSRLLAMVVLVLVAGGAAWFGWSQLGSTATEGTPPRLRFANVSIALPPEPSGHSGLTAFADYLPPEDLDNPAGEPVPIIVLLDVAAGGSLVLDATTGAVRSDDIGPEHRDAADAVVASVRLESGDVGVWPLADVAPAGSRITFSDMSYIEPDAASGIVVVPGEDAGPEGSSITLFVRNGRSRMIVDASTGEITEDRILREDREAFERFAASVAPRDAIAAMDAYEYFD